MENGGELFYSSFIFKIKEDKDYPSVSDGEKVEISQEFNQNQNNNQSQERASVTTPTSEQKGSIVLFEGPRKYQSHKSIFYFYDPHNKYFYGIPDNYNIFENGIKYTIFLKFRYFYQILLDLYSNSLILFNFHFRFNFYDSGNINGDY